MEMSKEILDYLRKITENREYNKREIADFCGTTRTQISYVINGHREPNRHLYTKLLQFVAKAKSEQEKRSKMEQELTAQ